MLAENSNGYAGDERRNKTLTGVLRGRGQDGGAGTLITEERLMQMPDTFDVLCRLGAVLIVC